MPPAVPSSDPQWYPARQSLRLDPSKCTHYHPQRPIVVAWAWGQVLDLGWGGNESQPPPPAAARGRWH